MSTNTPQQKNHRPIPAQVVELDQKVTELLGIVDQQQRKLAYLSVVSDALVAMMGEGEVQVKIDEMHVERMAPLAEVHKANTLKAVEDGKIVGSEVISPSSIVVAVERNKRNAITNLRTQIAMPLVPELHPLFVGKKAGDSVIITRGDASMTYEVLEVYEPTAKGLGQDIAENKEAPAISPGEIN